MKNKWTLAALFCCILLAFSGCKKEEVGTSADLMGRWKTGQQYIVFYADRVEEGVFENSQDYYWGKEWDESEDVHESDLKYHGNGWFAWKLDGKNLTMVHQDDHGWVVVPTTFEVTTLTSTTLTYQLPNKSHSLTYTRIGDK